MIIIDNFIDLYPELRAFANFCTFSDIENPTDGVVYPGICTVIPEDIKTEILARIFNAVHRMPEKVTMFMRRSPEGTPVPHIAHHDLSMGTQSLMLYLNDHPEGGTAFLRHRDTGICYAPEHEDFVEIARFDQNNIAEWAIIDQADMKQNRAVIFDAGLFHCALPVGGFGQGRHARTVLTVFFS